MKNTGYFLVKNDDEKIVKVMMGVRIRKPEIHIVKAIPYYKSFEMVDKETFHKADGLIVIL